MIQRRSSFQVEKLCAYSSYSQSRLGRWENGDQDRCHLVAPVHFPAAYGLPSVVFYCCTAMSRIRSEFHHYIPPGVISNCVAKVCICFANPLTVTITFPSLCIEYQFPHALCARDMEVSCMLPLLLPSL